MGVYYPLAANYFGHTKYSEKKYLRELRENCKKRPLSVNREAVSQN